MNILISSHERGFFWRWITRVLSLYLARAFNWCTKPLRYRTNKAYPWIGYQLNTLFVKVWHCWSCITCTHTLVQPTCKIVLYDCVGIVLENFVGNFRVVHFNIIVLNRWMVHTHIEIKKYWFMFRVNIYIFFLVWFSWENCWISVWRLQRGAMRCL